MEITYTMKTAEPFFIPGGEIGCLLVHGYTGTPKEMRLLGDSLAQEKYTILAPRLFGHATNPEDMNRARWWDWIASVEDGLNLLKGCTKQQIIMGLSMGGILSLIAAAKYPIKGVVSFSAPGSMPEDPRLKFLPLLKFIYTRAPKGKSDWHDPETAKDHVDYPYYPTQSISQLKLLIDEMRRELPNVKVPALFVQSKEDHGIPADSMDSIYAAVSSKDKTRFWVQNSGHVVIREPDREMIFAEVKKFVKRIIKPG